MLSAAFPHGNSNTTFETHPLTKEKPMEQDMEVYIERDTEEDALSSELLQTLTNITEYDFDYLKSLPSPEAYQSGPEWDNTEDGYTVKINVIREDTEIPMEKPKKATRKRGKQSAEKKSSKRPRCSVKHDEGAKTTKRPRNGERTRLKSSAFHIH